MKGAKSQDQRRGRGQGEDAVVVVGGEEGAAGEGDRRDEEPAADRDGEEREGQNPAEFDQQRVGALPLLELQHLTEREREREREKEGEGERSGEEKKRTKNE
jgi:hypothetical protein